MKNFLYLSVGAALGAASFASSASEEVSTTLFLTDVAGGYPYYLENGGELADGYDGYLYRKRQGHFELGGHFEDADQICFTISQTPNTESGIRKIMLDAIDTSGNKIKRVGGVVTKEGVPKCYSYSKHYEQYPTFSHWNVEIGSYRSRHEDFIPDVVVDDITITVKGKRWSSDQVVPSATNCEQGRAYVSAVENSISPSSKYSGTAVSCEIEANAVYELTLPSGISDAISNNVTSGGFHNVAVSYVSEYGSKVFSFVSESAPTYIKTQGIVQFAFLDSPEDNEGGVVVNFKKLD